MKHLCSMPSSTPSPRGGPVVMNNVWNVIPHTGVGESGLEFDTVKGDQGSVRPDVVPLASIPGGN